MKQELKLIAVDLDGTLCYIPEGEEHLGISKYIHCKPIAENIKLVNKLYDSGHEIFIYTARGMATFNSDVTKVYANLYEQTLNQLKDWGVKHSRLVMGKQSFDYLLDDKGLSLREKHVLESLLIKK
jgi:histidinol phosphatase-like enzyme